MNAALAVACVAVVVAGAVAAIQSYRVAYWRQRAREVDRRHTDAMAALHRQHIEAARWRDVAQTLLPNVTKLRRRG